MKHKLAKTWVMPGLINPDPAGVGQPRHEEAGGAE